MTDSEASAFIVTAFQAMSYWELLAVTLGLAYLILAMHERIECWYAAFASTAIYCALFWDVNLLMESALQVYYLGMAVYGWWHWQQKNNADTTTTIHRWSYHQHLGAFSLLVLLVFVSGYALQSYSSAAWPYVDSFTTWGSVITTYMVARKVLENWLYWIVIDGVSIFLYVDRGLYLTAILFALYVVLVIIGFFQWRKTFLTQQLNHT